jgi:general secretion pathway protein G
LPPRLISIVMLQNTKNIPIVYLVISFVLLTGSEAIASSKLGSVQARISIFEERLVLLKKDIGRYPTTNEGLNALVVAPPGVSNWRGPYVPYGAIPTDSWHHAYIYHYPAIYGDKEFDLYSMGKNGVDEKGKGDDITNWHGFDAWQYNAKGIILRYLVLTISILVMVLGVAYLMRTRILSNKSKA